MNVAPEPPSAAVERQLDADTKLSPLSVDPEEMRKHISEAEATGLPIKRIAQAQAQLDIVLEAQRLASEGLACEFYFILASKLLENSDMKSLPRWQELRETKPDWFVRRTLTFSESIQGAYTKEFVGVSHRHAPRIEPGLPHQTLATTRTAL